MTKEQRKIFREEALGLLLVSNFKADFDPVPWREVQEFVDGCSDIELLQAIEEDRFVTLNELRDKLVARGIPLREACTIAYADEPDEL
jgi:hypothetical protein